MLGLEPVRAIIERLVVPMGKVVLDHVAWLVRGLLGMVGFRFHVLRDVRLH
jgi:hypothetical protein